MNQIYKIRKASKLPFIFSMVATLFALSSAYAQLTPACSPSYTGSDFSHNIGSATIGTLSLSSISYSTHDYTAQSFSANAGDSVSFSLFSNGWCAVAVAADWNNDGDFDDFNEILATPNYINSAAATYNFKIMVPPTVLTGSYRVRLWNIGANSGGGSPAGSACGSYSWGSWLDVTINVTNTATCFPPTGLAVNNIQATSASFSWNASSTSPNSYIWKVVAAGDNPNSVSGVASGNTTDTFANGSGLSALTNYSLFVSSDCGSDTSLWSLVANFSTLCNGMPDVGTAVSSDSAVCAATNLALSLDSASAGAGISFQWQSSMSGQNSWTDLALDTLSSVTLNQSSATDYRCIVSCAGSGLSDTSNVVSVAQNPVTACYCTPPANNYGSSYNINSFSTTNGVSNITNNNSGNSSGSGNYSDFTSISVSALQTVGTVNFSVATASSAGIRIWVDWNQDGDFDDAGENVYTNTGSYGTTSYAGTFTVPSSAVVGNTRMRVRSNYYSYVNSQTSPCNQNYYGETEDYTFNVLPATGCIVPLNVAVGNITNTTATISWTAPPVGNTPQGYNYEVRTSGLVGSGATGLASSGSTTSTLVNISGLLPDSTYTAYVRTDCGSGDSSDWVSVSAFTTPLYEPIAITGLNKDVIANGSGPGNQATLSTNSVVDGPAASGYVYISDDFNNGTGTFSDGLPADRKIISGNKYWMLSDYSGNNTLKIQAQSATDTIHFSTPRSAKNISVLDASAYGSSAFFNVLFSDGTSYVSDTVTVANWYGGTPAIHTRRINRGNSGETPSNSSTGPNMYESLITIPNADTNKVITAIVVTKTTDTNNFLNIFAVSINPTSSSCSVPTGLAAQNITSTGANISWAGASSGYQLSYGIGLSDPELGTTIDTITMNSISLNGLLQNASSYSVYVRSICGTSAGDTSFWAGPVSFETLCDGTPTTGTLTSSAMSVCPQDQFTLTATGATAAPGISYMWQSSAHGMNTWDTLASTADFLSTSQSDTMDYRFIVSCSGSGQSDTALFTEVQNLPTDCYCTPTVTNTSFSDAYITYFDASGAGDGDIVNDNTGMSATGYTDYSDSMTVDGINTTQVNFSLQTDYGATVKIYVDWNHDGDFDDSGEAAYSYTGNYNTITYTGSITVPATALTGHTRMRVRTELYYYTISGPCANTYYGETEDYAINVIPLTPCAGMPAPGNTIAADSSFCVSGSTSLNLENSFAAISGVAFQWQQNVSGIWSDIQGDTLMTASVDTLTATTQFRCRLICSNGGDTAWSNPTTIAVHPLPTVTVSPQTVTFCSSSPVTLTAAGAMTYAWTPTDSLSADTGATVQANPSALTQYTVVGTDIYGCFASAMASVGPISAIKLDAAVSYSGACTGGNPMTISVSPISVNSGTIEYQFTDTSGNVLQAWSTDTAYTTTPASDGVYEYEVYAKISGCSDSTWMPGKVNAYVGFTGNVAVTNADCSGNAGGITVNDATGPGFASNVLWYQNDFSSTILNSLQAAKFGDASFTSGGLQLTPNTTSKIGALSVFNADQINPAELNVSFDLTVGSGADGFSYNFGNDATWANRTGNPEAGITNKLVVSFDAYGNSGIYLVYGNPVAPGATTPDLSSTGAHVLAYSNNTSWKNSTKQIDINVDKSGKVTLSVGSTLVFDHVQLPAAYLTTDKSNWTQTFIARTGGISELHAMDNLSITYGEGQLYYGLSAGGSGQLPSSWQAAGDFTGLPAADSFDVWMANPADSLNCNKLLGTYFIGAPALIAPAPQYTLGQQTCGADDATLTIQVDSAGTYGVRYRLNGDASFLWQDNIATINDGTANFITISNLAPGVYTDIVAFKGPDTCFSNMLADPVTLASVINGIATATSADSMYQGNGITLTYRNNNCEQIATVSSSADLGSVKTNVILDSVLYDSAGAPYAGRYYVITPSQNNGQPATLTVYFSNDDIAAYNSAVAILNNPNNPAMDTSGANILISAYHGISSAGATGPGGMFDSSSVDLITPTSVTDNGNYVAVTFTSTNGFSGFFAHTVSNSPLALTFGKISAENAGEKNVVKWNTLNEEAGNYFSVERSEDGRSFHKLGMVMGKGVAAEYAYDDDQPMSGVNYYRIAMVALNGHTIYSKVVSASMNTNRFNVAVYPNPVSDVLTVKVSDGNLEGATIEVRDVTGRLLKQIKVTNAQTQISMAGLAQGLYILKYQENNQERVFKINKK